MWPDPALFAPDLERRDYGSTVHVGLVYGLEGRHTQSSGYKARVSDPVHVPQAFF